MVGRAVWSLPTTADISLTARLNDDDDRDLLFDDDSVHPCSEVWSIPPPFPATCVMRSRARTLPVGNQVPDRKHYQEGVRPAEDFVIKYLREQKKLKLVSLLEQKLSKAAAARVERPDIEEGQHMLENNWTFWFDNYAKPVTNSSCIWEKQSFEQTVTELGSFNSIEGFWSYWNHLRVGSLKDNCNLRMFQKGTRPTCEVWQPCCGFSPCLTWFSGPHESDWRAMGRSQPAKVVQGPAVVLRSDGGHRRTTGRGGLCAVRFGGCVVHQGVGGQHPAVA